MRSNYKRLADYIKEVNVRNSDLKINNLLGINIDKFFMPSVANVVGTDMTNYKVVKKGQFACNRMHVGRDKRLPVALLKHDDDVIVSPAYNVFEITDTDTLLPEYLMMWFSRKEFDRNAWFYTDADVRGGLNWRDFCNMQIAIPSITKQKEIVKEYNVLVDRISLNNQLIQRLEKTAQAIYKQWFIDFEFPNENGNPYKSSGDDMEFNEELEKEIPKGWEVLNVKEFCLDMKSGGTPSRAIPVYWNRNDIPWLKTGEISNNILFSAEEYISNEGLKRSSAKLLPKDTVLMSMYGVNAGDIGILKFEATTNQACCGMICEDERHSAYLYYHLLHNQAFISSQSIGGAQENLSKNFIEKIRLLKPSKELLNKDDLKTLIDNKEYLTREIALLKTFINLLLSKLATVES